MDFYKDLGVKGFCFRGFDDNKTVAEMVKACELDIIDLSGCQVNFKDPSTHQSAIDTFKKAEIKIVGIGAVQVTGKADDEEFFKFCQKAGCSTISFSGQPDTFFDALPQLERWADEYDMKLAIHNHGGYDWLGSSQMLKHVFKRSSKRIGLCLDSAWTIQAGENPVKWLDIFADRVYAVHYKDFTFDKNGKHEDVIIGQGALDLPAFIKGLKAIKFEGPAVIEYEADVNNPVPALSECVKTLRQVISNG